MTFSFEIGARTLWMEARGEPLNGQQAVAHVLWNRFRDGRWGKSLAEVCLAPLQFSCWNTTDPNRMAAARLPDTDPHYVALQDILSKAESEPDPTNGALYYYAASMKTPPSWAKIYRPVGRFGNQLFFREK